MARITEVSGTSMQNHTEVMDKIMSKPYKEYLVTELKTSIKMHEEQIQSIKEKHLKE